MSGWPIVRLGDVATIERRTIQPRDIPNGETYVGLENVTSEGRFVDVTTVDIGDLKSSKFKFSSEHLLYGKLRPYLAKIAAPDFGGVCSTDILPIRAGEHIARGYLLHYLRTPRMVKRAATLAVGVNLPRLSPKTLEAFSVPLPPIEEQRRIAAVLDAADALRTKRREALAKLDTLTQAIFIDMFGDPLRNDRAWPSQSLEELSQGIFDCPHSTPRWADAGDICLRTSNLGKGSWNWADTRYVSPETFEERSTRAYLDAGDIILSREGTVGIAAIVQPGMRLCMGQRLVQVRPDEDLALSEFLLDVLLFLLQPDRIGRVMTGSTSKHVNVGQLRALEIIEPPMDDQERYVELVTSFREKRVVMAQASTALDTLFVSLQQRVFRGEL